MGEMREFTIKEIGETTRKRLKKDWDAVIGLSGYEGSGKSTLAIHLGEAIDPNFDLLKNVLYDPSYSSVSKVLYGLPKYSALVVDEAARVLYKRRWADKFQIMLGQVFMICRELNQASILCMPRFTDFDASFRKHRIFLWIQVINRGTAVIFKKSKNFFGDDPWYLKDNEKSLDKRLRKKDIIQQSDEDLVNAAGKAKNFFGVLQFPELSKAKKKTYLKYKRKYSAKLAIELSETGRTLKNKEIIKILVKEQFKTGKNQAEIARLTGMNSGTINTILKEDKLRKVDKPPLVVKL